MDLREDIGGNTEATARPAHRAVSESFEIFGVNIVDIEFDDALALLSSIAAGGDSDDRTVFYVNAHTLNIAARDPAFVETLNSADHVFGDGTGVRWAARLIHGRRILGNVNGTDMTPALLETLAAQGLRYYLVGGTDEMVSRVAGRVGELFPGWVLAGYHHGYLDDVASQQVVNGINAAAPDVLLVGMGNPLQERWLAANSDSLRVPLRIGVGGLFAYWAGDLDRAPTWMRRLGIEWLHLLRRQPRKARRYLFGNPAFLARAMRQRLRRRA